MHGTINIKWWLQFSSSLHSKMCVSSHALSKVRQITVRFRGQYRTVGPQELVSCEPPPPSTPLAPRICMWHQDLAEKLWTPVVGAVSNIKNSSWEQCVVKKYKVVQIWPGLFTLVYNCKQSRSYLNHLVVGRYFRQRMTNIEEYNCNCKWPTRYNYCVLFIYSYSALHVSGDVIAHHQEHLTVLTTSDIVHWYCCRLLSWMRSNWTFPFHPWHQPAAIIGGKYQKL